MTPSESVTVDLTGLPEPVIRSIRQLVESLRRVSPPEGGAKQPHARRPLLGRFEHLNLDFTKEEIDEAQREMWANFPREFP